MKKKIDTRQLRDYLFINLYAIILFVLAIALLTGALAFVLLLNNQNLSLIKKIILVVVLIVLSLFFIFSSVRIFLEYDEKMIKIKQGINYYYENKLDNRYYKYFLLSPCSKIMLRYILKQVDRMSYYRYLKKKYREDWFIN